MQIRALGTHDGSFHADEVTAAALLVVFNRVDRDKIVRTRDEKLLDACEYVCDVGNIYDPSRKRFDHHQVDYTGQMSSAGMVLLYLWKQEIIDERKYNFLNQSFILGVDAHDTGRVILEPGVATFSQIIANFVPPDYDAPDTEMRHAFDQALDFVIGHVHRLMERYDYVQQCREVVVKAMSKRGVALIFDKAMPWMDVFFEMDGEHHPAQFVVMPSGSHWKLRGIPPNSRDKMGIRSPLPEKWAGLRDEQLQKETGIPGAIFCHKGRFISIWETKDDALAALKQVTR